MRYLGMMLAATAVTALAGCGGGGGRDSGRDYERGPVVARFASGPMQSACMTSDRKSRNAALCGCIQAVANSRLTPTDQRLAASFWHDPHKAQVIRQSDSARDEVFWKKYSAFGGEVEALCRPSA